MEEDIKNIEEIINLSKEEIENNDENITAILDLEDLKSLENLLTRYKELEEENEKWQRAYQEEKEKQFELLREKDSIPKSLVKEKIEELEGSMNKAKPFDISYIEYCEDRIEVLQELLREE